MKSNRWADLGGVWALAWRSIVLLPLMVLAFGSQVLVAAALVALPVSGLVSLACGEWGPSAVMLAAWAVLVLGVRRFRWREYVQWPGSVL